MKIERAQENDHIRLTEITFAGKSFWGYDNVQLEKWRSDLTISADYITDNETYKLVLNEETIGYFSIIKVDNDTIILDNIFLLPDYIGKGYGRFLMLDCIERAKIQQAKRIILDAEPNAENFYRNFGFETIGQFESSIKNRFLPQMQLILSEFGLLKSG